MGEHEVRRAVFLDRDGVLNRAQVREGKPYPPDTLGQFELLPHVAEACGKLKRAGFVLVVATNQPDIGSGKQSIEVVEAMHRKMCAALPIDHIEMCCDVAESSPFKKPAPGMLVRAAGKLGIDLQHSFMVGDRWRDVDCGHAAGCTTIFIDHGYAESLRAQPDFRVSNLLEAANVILTSAPNP